MAPPVTGDPVHLLYLVYREALGPVFVSQTATSLGMLEREGVAAHLAVLTPVGEFLRPGARKRWRALRRGLPAVYAGPIDRIPSPPSRARRAWDDARMLALWLRRRRSDGRGLVIQCRNAVMTSILLRAGPPRGARVVYDCRGVTTAEYLYRRGFEEAASAPPGMRARAAELIGLERRAALESDAVLCVSEAMARHMVSTFSVPRGKITVVPCCVDDRRFAGAASERERVRRELGLADRFVVVYSGSLHRWQMPELGLRMFRAIKAIEPSAHYLGLVTEPDRMREVVAASGLTARDATVLRVDPPDMPAHLAAADVGLLLREDSPVNRVASPVKFAEYLAAGVPVIISEGVGDYSDLVAREQLGAVLGHDAGPETWASKIAPFFERCRAEPEPLRQRCREIAASRLAWSVHVPAVTSLYRRLVAEA